MVCNSRKISDNSMMPLAMSLIARSRCSMAASFWPVRRWDVCMRVDWEKDLSASDSIKDGSVYGFCIGVGVRSNGDDPPSRPRSSGENSQPCFFKIKKNSRKIRGREVFFLLFK